MNEATIHLHLDDDPFARVRKAMLDNNELSWKAKGILAYLIGKPQGWRLMLGDLVNRSNDGEASVRSGVMELRCAGYVKLVQLRHEGKIVRWTYHVSDKPIFPKSNTVETVDQVLNNRQVEDRALSKNEVTKIEEKEQKEADAFFEAKNQEFGTEPPDGVQKPPKSKKSPALAVIPASLDSPAFVCAWGEWLAYRKQRQRGLMLTLATQEKQLAKLTKWGPSKAIVALDKAIEAGWLGFFEPKENYGNGTNRQNNNFGIVQSDPTGRAERIAARQQRDKEAREAAANRMAT